MKYPAAGYIISSASGDGIRNPHSYLFSRFLCLSGDVFVIVGRPMDRITSVNIEGIEKATGFPDVIGYRCLLFADFQQLYKVMDGPEIQSYGKGKRFEVFLGGLLEVKADLGEIIGVFQAFRTNPKSSSALPSHSVTISRGIVEDLPGFQNPFDKGITSLEPLLHLFRCVDDEVSGYLILYQCVKLPDSVDPDHGTSSLIMNRSISVPSFMVPPANEPNRIIFRGLYSLTS